MPLIQKLLFRNLDVEIGFLGFIMKRPQLFMHGIYTKPFLYLFFCWRPPLFQPFFSEKKMNKIFFWSLPHFQSLLANWSKVDFVFYNLFFAIHIKLSLKNSGPTW